MFPKFVPCHAFFFILFFNFAFVGIFHRAQIESIRHLIIISTIISVLLQNKRKIFNDPVYGFISIPFDITFDLIEHPAFQRLRRINQLGLTHYVYPGALHTRFHHALGALHLMTQAIEVLKSKGIAITEEEAQAVCIAILLHDIGHGPFSHALESSFVPISHEEISILFMKMLNVEFSGKLSLAIDIFSNHYEKPYLHQLVSGQLDMDRLDYLNRDSFYTGVSEGVIGYDRIIKMLAVVDGQLVIEEKGIFSIEKFLIARRLMYWQVYLHKTSVCVEQMLITTLKRARFLALRGLDLPVSQALATFLYREENSEIKEDTTYMLRAFAALDDVDIMAALKAFASYRSDSILSFLSASILNRQLFRIEVSAVPFQTNYINKINKALQQHFPDMPDAPAYLIIQDEESNAAYRTDAEEISIVMKNGRVKPISAFSDLQVNANVVKRYFLCYPKSLDTNLMQVNA